MEPTVAGGREDINQTAFGILARLLDMSDSSGITLPLEGGKVRRGALAPGRRSDIAKNVAKKRGGDGGPGTAAKGR